MREVVKQELEYNDGTRTVLERSSVPEGIYAYALHDYESKAFFRERDRTGKWGYSVPRSLIADKDKLKNWQGWPEMVPMKPREGVKLTEPIQWWWGAQLAWSKYRKSIFEYDRPNGSTVTVRQQFYEELTKTEQDYIKTAFYKLTADQTAFTNGSGTNDRQNPTGKCYLTNTGSGTPVLWENGCGGSTYKVNSKAVHPDMEWIEIATLKTSEYKKWRAWKYDDPRYRCFFTFATNSTPFLVGTRDTVTERGPWKVDAMHFLDGATVPVPLISDEGYVYIHHERVEIIYNMKEYRRPYNP